MHKLEWQNPIIPKSITNLPVNNLVILSAYPRIRALSIDKLFLGKKLR